MEDKEKFETIMNIVNRAEAMGILRTDKFSALMDLDYAVAAFNLRLKDFLNADELNFTHDFVQIQEDIDRKTCKFSGRFLPRFAGGEVK